MNNNEIYLTKQTACEVRSLTSTVPLTLAVTASRGNIPDICNNVWFYRQEVEELAKIKEQIVFKVYQNSFQHFPRRRFWWVIIITLYQLMLQS